MKHQAARVKGFFSIILVMVVLALVSGPIANAEAAGGTLPSPAVLSDQANRAFRVTIVESQSINSQHIMDTKWQAVASAMGYAAQIVPQSTLENTDFFTTTDILIISSGIIPLPVQSRNVISQFIQQGGPVYLQSEYQCTYQANETFAEIVNAFGGSFTWGSIFTGQLISMNVLGSLATTPNFVPTLTYFWYGCSGSGDETIKNYLEYQGNYFGFLFTPPTPGYGVVITNSDQDWVKSGKEEIEPMMQNILFALGYHQGIRMYFPLIIKD